MAHGSSQLSRAVCWIHSADAQASITHYKTEKGKVTSLHIQGLRVLLVNMFDSLMLAKNSIFRSNCWMLAQDVLEQHCRSNRCSVELTFQLLWHLQPQKIPDTQHPFTHPTLIYANSFIDYPTFLQHQPQISKGILLGHYLTLQTNASLMSSINEVETNVTRQCPRYATAEVPLTIDT